MVGLFFAFGVVSNLFDHESLLYNIGQGLFISLFVGGVLYIARRISIRKSARTITPAKAGYQKKSLTE